MQQSCYTEGHTSKFFLLHTPPQCKRNFLAGDPALIPQEFPHTFLSLQKANYCSCTVLPPPPPTLCFVRFCKKCILDGISTEHRFEARGGGEFRIILSGSAILNHSHLVVKVEKKLYVKNTLRHCVSCMVHSKPHGNRCWVNKKRKSRLCRIVLHYSRPSHSRMARCQLGLGLEFKESRKI